MTWHKLYFIGSYIITAWAIIYPGKVVEILTILPPNTGGQNETIHSIVGFI